jgi:hypothetical protein
LPPTRLADHPTAINAIQQHLLEDDALVIGRTNNDPHDFARRANVTASSEQPQGPAKNAIVGQTRSIHGPNGAPPERTIAGTHRWMSDPAAGLPAWIQLEWPEPISPSRLQLIFDTGLHRVMTFSLADSYTQQMLWGQPQPETVRNYQVETRWQGNWHRVANVEGNYQRRNTIALNCKPFDGLRIIVSATNGSNSARICEIRVV